MYTYVFIILFIFIGSTFMYLYLHHKTRMQKKYIYIDNVFVVVFSSIVFLVLYKSNVSFTISSVIAIILIPLIGFLITMIRFWRTPNRKVPSNKNFIVSPADGNVIYIKNIKKNTTPISVKGKNISRLDELTKTNLLNKEYVLIGINMTPFDVHKNCSPIDGKIIFFQYTPGKFLSLKSPDSETENERATYIISNDDLEVGVIQIASKLVRRIDSYVRKGDQVAKGDWIGMIRFGSQVDVILPINTNIKIKVGQQIYARKTVIAEMK